MFFFSPKKLSFLSGTILLLCFAFIYVAAVWQEPGQIPPEGNVATPINTGSLSQSKEGRISAAQFGDTDNQDYYLNPSGNSKLGGALTLKPTTRPIAPEPGQMYFDDNEKSLYYYDSAGWRRVGVGACLEQCSVCQECYYGKCFNFPEGEKDDIGLDTCAEPHYACNGLGECENPKVENGSYLVAYKNLDWGWCWSYENGTGEEICRQKGHEGCLYYQCDGGVQVPGCDVRPTDVVCSYYPCNGPVNVVCWDWQYDE